MEAAVKWALKALETALPSLLRRRQDWSCSRD
jgi:hypothetical protein